MSVDRSPFIIHGDYQVRYSANCDSCPSVTICAIKVENDRIIRKLCDDCYRKSEFNLEPHHHYGDFCYYCIDRIITGVDRRPQEQPPQSQESQDYEYARSWSTTPNGITVSGTCQLF